MLHAGQEIKNGKYRLIGQIGKGAQGEVWAAEQRGIGLFSKEIVLKFVVFDGAEKVKLQQLLLQEARLCAELSHPSIVSILDADEEEGHIFIAMERIYGLDISIIAERYTANRQRPIPWEIVAYLMVRVCRGLHYAHTKSKSDNTPLNLVHRDLKPHNLLLSEQGEVKIIDFGIAKAYDSLRKTQTDMIKGTPAYMSPEQITSQPLDARSDLFSVGIILYELCSGELPFYAAQMFSMLYKIIQDEPTPIQEVAPHIPSPLAAIITKLLAKSPDDRFQSAKELQQALNQVLQAEGMFVNEDTLADFYAELQALPSVAKDPDTPMNNGLSSIGAMPLVEKSSALPTPVPGSIQMPTSTAAIDFMSGGNHIYLDASIEKENDPLARTTPDQEDDDETEVSPYVSPANPYATQDTKDKDKTPQAAPQVTIALLVALALLVAAMGGLYLMKSPSIDEPPTHQMQRPKAPSNKTPQRKAAPKSITKRIAPGVREAAKKAPINKRLPLPKRRVATRRRVVRATHGTISITLPFPALLFEQAKGKQLPLGKRRRLRRRPGTYCFLAIAKHHLIYHRFCHRLKAGQQKRLRLRFSFGYLHVHSEKSILIFMNKFGQIGKAGKRIRLPSGTHKLKMMQTDDAMKNRTVQVTIKPNTTHHIKNLSFH